MGIIQDYQKTKTLCSMNQMTVPVVMQKYVSCGDTW